MATRIRQDYGVQPQNKKNKESFVDFMQQTTWFNAMTKALQRHSEFMRPELGDYPDMEYGFPDLPSGKNLVPTDQQGSDLNPSGGCVLSCYAPLYCDDDVECHFSISQGGPIPIQMTARENNDRQPVSGDRMSMPSHQTDSAMDAIYRQTRGEGYSLPGSDYVMKRRTGGADANVFPIRIAAPSGGWPHWPEEPSTKLKVCAQDQAGNVCCTKLTVFCRREDCCQQSDYVAMTFDDGSTPDQVAPNSSISVYVSGGCPPFAWSVSGTGFSFLGTTTDARVNTLSLANTACGGVGGHSYQGTLTISDNCGTSVTAVILATDGAWTQYYGFSRSSTCELLACCAPQTCTAPPSAPVSTVYHHQIGVNKNEAKWRMYTLTGCASDCRSDGNGNHTFGGGSGCPSDTILGSEYCATGACCDCAGYLDYWTCGGNC